jgi:alpha-N-arabinofuranosidase
MNNIKIDLERVLSDIDRNIFGGYMEFGHLDTKFSFLDVGDSPDADKYQLRPDVRSALEQMNISNIRFPGGNFASGYRWMDGIGPRDRRPTRRDLAHNCLIANSYGTNEFIKFCRAMNIEPYLCVNCGDGDMREAADWVEYCNGTGDTAPVKLRREHGFEKPHKVKYWGIGNEVDSPGQIGAKTPQEYARAYTEFSKVLKRVDPEIKLIASAVCSWEDFPLGPQFLYRKTEWVERTQLMLEQAGDRIDYLALHRYAHPHEDDPYETYMAFAADLNERLTAYEGLIRAVSLERGIKHNIGIAFDEWAVARIPGGLHGEAPVSIARDEFGVMRPAASSNEARPVRKRILPNLENSLVTGLYLNAFIRHAYSVRLASFSSMPHSIGMNLKRPENKVLLETIFYPFALYSSTCGQLALDVFWTGDTFSGTYKDRTFTGIRTLDVAATLNKARKQLVVYVVNQSKDETMEATITLTSGHFTGNIKVSVVNGPDIKAENTEDNPNLVGIHDTSIIASGNSFTLAFEPHSVTALICDVG